MDHTKVEENADWILESLVSYLSSPVWNVPILNFMEQKSVGKPVETILTYTIAL